MHSLSFVAVPVACVAAIAFAARAQSDSQMQLTPADKAAGWKALFDGTSTDAWRGYKQQAFPQKGWVVEKGVLKVQAGQGGGDIVTKDQYGDFELILEFATTPKANSGIIYRLTENPEYPWQTGPEFQILDDAGQNHQPDHPHSAGAMYDLYSPVVNKMLKPAGEFNHVRIRLQNNHLEHWLNGVKVVACDVGSDEFRSRVAASKFSKYEGFGAQPKGHIALQDHGDEVWFRNIRVRDLSAPMPGEIRLFDGKSLKGWTAHLDGGAKMEDVWRVEDGVLICKGEPAGYIRTEADHGNYVLKLQWRFSPVTKKAGNSGVLMRMTGPDKIWPKSVEAQLMSGNAGDFFSIDGFKMSTATERTNGRHTRRTADAENALGEWNEYEIIMDGPKVVLKVNGQTLNEAWNADETAGKICLQSEGAEIHFQNIRLAPIK